MYQIFLTIFIGHECDFLLAHPGFSSGPPLQTSPIFFTSKHDILDEDMPRLGHKATTLQELMTWDLKGTLI